MSRTVLASILQILVFIVAAMPVVAEEPPTHGEGSAQGGGRSVVGKLIE